MVALRFCPRYFSASLPVCCGALRGTDFPLGSPDERRYRRVQASAPHSRWLLVGGKVFTAMKSTLGVGEWLRRGGSCGNGCGEPPRRLGHDLVDGSFARIAAGSSGPRNTSPKRITRVLSKSENAALLLLERTGGQYNQRLCTSGICFAAKGHPQHELHSRKTMQTCPWQACGIVIGGCNVAVNAVHAGECPKSMHRVYMATSEVANRSPQSLCGD